MGIRQVSFTLAAIMIALTAPNGFCLEPTRAAPSQLFVLVDMEGASEITEAESDYLDHGSKAWRKAGREIITSDVKAVCDGANDFGITEIMVYDMHCAGEPEPNVMVESLPKNVRMVDVPDRRLDMRRIRGQVASKPFGMIFVGQHARAGTPKAYFPHSIQPAWKDLRINGLSIAEIGYTGFNFPDVKLLAVIGDAAAMDEAAELYPLAAKIPVKDKVKHWTPSRAETRKTIRERALAALKTAGGAQSLQDTVLKRMPNVFDFSLTLEKGYYFDMPQEISWKGQFTRDKATWQAASAEIGLELLWEVNSHVKKGYYR